MSVALAFRKRDRNLTSRTDQNHRLPPPDVTTHRLAPANLRRLYRLNLSDRVSFNLQLNGGEISLRHRVQVCLSTARRHCPRGRHEDDV